MNRKIVFNIVGRMFEIMSLFLLLPLVVSIIYRETKSFFAFAVTIVISLLFGVFLRFFTRNYNKVMYAREGFLAVALVWLAASLVGCLPFLLSGEVTSFSDAFFETVSGFTTTGASVLDVTKLSHGILLWRSFTHWIGGMGVLVFMVAFMSNISDRAMHVLRAEMPGPVIGKIVPKARDTSKVLYIMYIVLTLIQIVALWLGEMNLFESTIHSFGTAGTGGFGIRGDSVASYSSYSQWIIIAFMVIFGVNFNLYYLMTIRRFKAAIKSTELWTYFGIITVSTVLIAVNLTMNPNPSYGFSGIGETIKNSVFQVSSIVTTTGYASADFNIWPDFSKSILLVLIFSGACAGSTAGGLKISRVILLFKMCAKEVKRMVHPRSVVSVKLEGKEIEEDVQKSVTTYFSVYIICILAFFLIIGFEPFGFETNFTAVVTCFNNVGPGFDIVGPYGSFAGYSPFSKIILSLAMLMGRLEIFPVLIALIPSAWRKKK